MIGSFNRILFKNINVLLYREQVSIKLLPDLKFIENFFFNVSKILHSFLLCSVNLSEQCGIHKKGSFFITVKSNFLIKNYRCIVSRLILFIIKQS